MIKWLNLNSFFSFYSIFTKNNISDLKKIFRKITIDIKVRISEKINCTERINKIIRNYKRVTRSLTWRGLVAGVSWPEPSDISFCSTITLVFRYPLLLSAFILSQPSDNQNPWINWGGGLDTPGRIWSGELCQRPVQCWHRGYTRSAAADRSSILDKHILSFFLSFLSRIFLFLISFNTFERNKAKQSLREFLSSSSWEQKKKKNYGEIRSTLNSSISDRIQRKKSSRDDRVPIHRRRRWDAERMKKVGQLFCVPKGSVTAVLLASIPPTPTTSVLPAPSTRPLPHPQPPILFTIRARPPGWGFWTDHRFFYPISTIFYHLPCLFIAYINIYIFLNFYFFFSRSFNLIN